MSCSSCHFILIQFSLPRSFYHRAPGSTLRPCCRSPRCVPGPAGTKQQEIVVSRGKILELLRPDPNTGKVHTLLTVEVFGVIRSLMAFRLTGGTKDYIVVGSDSGRIVILEYQPSKNVFEKIHQETFGKSGCRRIVPGQYLAVDPKGRAVMISESPGVGFFCFVCPAWGWQLQSELLPGVNGVFVFRKFVRHVRESAGTWAASLMLNWPTTYLAHSSLGRQLASR